MLIPGVAWCRCCWWLVRGCGLLCLLGLPGAGGEEESGEQGRGLALGFGLGGLSGCVEAECLDDLGAGLRGEDAFSVRADLFDGLESLPGVALAEGGRELGDTHAQHPCDVGDRRVRVGEEGDGVVEVDSGIGMARVGFECDHGGSLVHLFGLQKGFGVFIDF